VAQTRVVRPGPICPRKLFVFFETGFSQAPPFSGSETSGLWITRITRPARDDAYIAPQTSRFDA
jgi:hypothetical protein